MGQPEMARHSKQASEFNRTLVQPARLAKRAVRKASILSLGIKPLAGSEEEKACRHTVRNSNSQDAPRPALANRSTGWAGHCRGGRGRDLLSLSESARRVVGTRGVLC